MISEEIMKRIKLIWVLALIAICSCSQQGQSETKNEIDTTVCESVHLYDEKPTFMTSIKTKYTWIDSDGKKYPVYLMDTMCYVVKECDGCGMVFYKQLPKEIYNGIKDENR